MLTIKHSYIVDLRTFFSTLRNKRWLDENKYIYRLFWWPHRCAYKQLAGQIQQEFSKYEPKLKDAGDIKVYLTHCGTYGSYDLPNIVYAYCHRLPQEIAETIVHETVHLETEQEVLKDGLSHEEKEKLVEDRVQAILGR